MRLVVLLGVAAGCGASGTSLVVELSLRGGDPPPSALAVSVFGDSGPLALAATVGAPVLPGRILVRALPDVDQTVRVAITGTSMPRTEAGARVDIHANTQTTVSIQLAADTPDADGDGIPDELDDCPHTADPRQDGMCVAGDGSTILDLVGLQQDLTSTPLDGSQGQGDLAMPRCGPGVASRCPGSGLAFCDGFEGATIDASKWSTSTNLAGTVSIDGSKACRGSSSLQAKLDLSGDVGTYGQADLYETRTFPSEPIHVRLFVWFPSTAPAVAVQLGQISQNTNPYGGITFGVDPGRKLYFGPYTIAAGNATGSNGAIPEDRWVCFEWSISNGAVAGSAGESRLWMDGVELPEMLLTPVAATPQFGMFEMGSDTSGGPQPPFKVWIDEVAVDSVMIGCDSMRALVLLLALVSATARAESPAELEARQHFTAAQKLFEHAHWAEAVVEYQASYALSKYPAILYKIALCQDQLGQLAEALESYQKYLAADPGTDRRHGIEERVARLKELLAPKPPPEEKPAPVVVPAATVEHAPTVAPAPTVAVEKSRPVPAYKKWWVWTIVGVGVAGIALGVGLGVGLQHSFSPNLGTFNSGLHF